MEQDDRAQTVELPRYAAADALQTPTTQLSGKLLGRAQAARLLGVSKSTLRRMEGDVLTPVVGPKNVRFFREEEIHSLVVTRRFVDGGPVARATGDVAAEVFELFDQGVHPVDAVKRLRVDPDLIESLHQRWARLRKLIVLTECGTTKIYRLLSDDGSSPRPTNETELLAFVDRWMRDESVRRSEQCRREGAEFCRACSKAWGMRAARNEITTRRKRCL